MFKRWLVVLLLLISVTAALVTGGNPVAAASVTLTLYVHELSATDPVVVGARVTGWDAAGASFDKTTNSSGYVIISGAPGTWQFTISAAGFNDRSWSQSTTSNVVRHAFFLERAPVTLTLYVHELRATDPVVVGARVTGRDAAGVSFDKTTNSSGYVIISGAPGTWQFTISAAGFNDRSWSQSTTSNVVRHAFFLERAPVTLTLYVHELRATDPVVVGARVTGRDAAGVSFDKTTNSSGYVIISGASGTWQFTISAAGFDDRSWSQPITSTTRKDAFFLTKSLVTLTLYVHELRASDPVVVGARVTGRDAAGVSFDKTTNSSGYVTITGAPGTWQFTISAPGFKDRSWTQPITATTRKDAFFLEKLVELKPDLIVEDIWTDPTTPVEGSSFKIKARVKNIGSAQAACGPLCNQELFFFQDNVHVGEDNYDDLDPGASIVLESPTLTAPAAGSHSMKASADANNEINEENEGNNERTGSFSTSVARDFFVGLVDAVGGTRLSLPMSFWGFSSDASEDFTTDQKEDPINLIFFSKQADPNDVADALVSSGWSSTPLLVLGLPCPVITKFAFSELVMGSGQASDRHVWKVADHYPPEEPPSPENECNDQYHIRLWDWGTVLVGGETFEVSLGQVHHECSNHGGSHTVSECAFFHVVVEWDLEDIVRNDLTIAGRVADHWKSDFGNTGIDLQWRDVDNDGIATVVQLRDLCTTTITVGQTAPDPQPFVDSYNRNGQDASVGCPTNTVHRWSDGYTQDFDGGTGEKGALMFRDGTSTAYWVHGSIWRRYIDADLGGAAGFLGYPLTDESPGTPSSITGSLSRFNNFVGGSIEHHATGPRAGLTVWMGHGIKNKWELLGFGASDLGLPITDEREALGSPFGTAGRVTKFEGGQIHWHRNGPRANQAFETHGAIDSRYELEGGSGSALGFPVSDEFPWESFQRSDFEGGVYLLGPSSQPDVCRHACA